MVRSGIVTISPKKCTTLRSFSKENVLRSYYIDLNYFLMLPEHYGRIVYDEAGIPVFMYDPPIGPKYNPTTVSLHAIASYQIGEYSKFFKYVKWLIEHFHYLNDKIFLYIEFPFPPRAHKPHWTSGLTQGLAASTMVRAYIKTGDAHYLIYAQGLIDGMLTPIGEGGCLFTQGDSIWIEEYPLEKPPKHVLNGLIFAMLGLYDVYLATQKREFLRKFKELFFTLEKNTKLFDLFLWSRYDSSPRNISGKWYHLLNTTLLYAISRLTNSLKMRVLAERWYLGYIILGRTLNFSHCYRKPALK